MNTTNPDRLGYYRVGWKKFYHKTLALIESRKTRYDLEWIFNDDVYGAIDWSVPIVESLDELYRQRAQQLRDKYDYILLYFSGGADSSNMLRAFINNNIFVDEIIMQSPEPVKNKFNNVDKSSVNVYSEIPFSAVPILNELKNLMNPATKVRYQDTSKGIIELLNNDNWFEYNPFGVAMGVNELARQYASFEDPEILRLTETGKRVAQVVGTDKPMLMNINSDYYCYFIDGIALHCPPVELNLRDMLEKSLHTEFFYWTPDLPQIVVKQAQEVKKLCELNLQAKKIICNTKLHVEKLRAILHPVIYPSMPEVPFQTGKGSSGAVREKDFWFWNNAEEIQKNNFKSVIDYLQINIRPEDFKNGEAAQGLAGHRSRLYKL
jgi:hypothetical protein